MVAIHRRQLGPDGNTGLLQIHLRLMSLNTSRRDERWVCRRRADFALRNWPDGSVLFDEANGQLQRLPPAAGLSLRHI